jgi:hypothetical protein
MVTFWYMRSQTAKRDQSGLDPRINALWGQHTRFHAHREARRLSTYSYTSCRLDLGAAEAAGRVAAQGHASSVANRTACRVTQARTHARRSSHASAPIDAHTHAGLSPSGPGHDVHAALLQGLQLHVERKVRHSLGAPSDLRKKNKERHIYANK